MKNKALFMVLLFVICLVAVVNVFAHSGKTDANGGHWNHSTGEYHYHHGYKPHSHPNGVCPYAKKETSVPETKSSISSNNALEELKKKYSIEPRNDNTEYMQPSKENEDNTVHNKIVFYDVLANIIFILPWLIFLIPWLVSLIITLFQKLFNKRH